MNFANLFTNINPKEVLKNLPDAVFVVEADGKISWVNDKASVVFEEKRGNLANYYFNDLVSNGLELAEKSASKKNSVVTAAFTPDNKEFFIEMNAKKFVEQYFITIRDITAMTNVLAVAEKTGRLNKEKNTMLVKLSNEFKSPVQSIIGFSQALLDGLGGDITEKQGKYFKIINKNSNDLLYFLDKFLEFSQAESSLYTYDYQLFDVVNTVNTIIKQNEPFTSAKNLVVNFDYEELEKKTIFSDENALKIILQNILETSIKLTDIGAITIKAVHPDINLVERSGIKFDASQLKDLNSFIQFSVTDTGMGLAESELEGIFEPYTLLDKPSKKLITRAITLGTAATIVKRLKGAIWVESEVMKGTTFNVILPIEKEIKSNNE